MCGIAGFAARTERDARVGFETLACAELSHRGPDAHGERADDGVAFRHWRLSIIDPSPAGAQPMVTEDQQVVLSYNGEVYNFREVARDLGLDDLRSHSDTEVVLRTYQMLGTDAFRRLNGMFALAIHDRRTSRLVLARDRLGIKPLYYRVDAGGLTFASELTALVSRESALQCDLSALHEWLYYGTTLGGRTLYRGVQQVPPGHFVEVDLETFAVRTTAYWSLQQQARREDRVKASTNDVIAETRRLLEAAVQRQLVSDVPVGVFLSGGIDSSAITAFASRHYDGKLATYSAGFDDLKGVDERPKARQVAALYGTDHHEVHIRGNDVADIVELLVRHHGAPFSDAANIPLYLMAAQISHQTKVVLQGDGGDEVFGGYRRYSTLAQYPWMHPAARAARPLTRALPRSRLQQRVARYVDAFAQRDLGKTMALLLTIEDERSRPARVFRDPYRTAIEHSDPFARYRVVQRQFADHDISSQMALVDLMVELPDTFLEKVDRSTMAASLEVRVPFLDHDLVDYVVRVPAHQKTPRGQKKWLLKQALRGIVPDDILYGPKTGFNVPFGFWLLGELKPLFFDHLATFELRHPNVIDSAVLMKWFRDTETQHVDRTYMLWKMLNFMIWANTTPIAFVV